MCKKHTQNDTFEMKSIKMGLGRGGGGGGLTVLRGCGGGGRRGEEGRAESL